MIRTSAHVSVSYLPTPVVVLTVLFASASVGGCQQAKEGTNSTTGEEDVQVSVRDQLPGCWSLRITAQGAQRDSMRSWLPAGSLPSIIELDTTLAESGSRDNVYRAYSWFDDRRESQPFSVWRRAKGDSIRVQRADALSGTMLKLGPSEGKLVGSVVQFTDRMGSSERRSGPVEADPAECPSR